MPLVRFQVRNEYSLGQPQLYKEVNREDPKAVLDGVAVSGLVGILRQLGDLAEFAAEVFHGLQEQVMTTASRSHKLIVRVQHIEAALPSLEKAVLAQTSHIHFAYTGGIEWHPRIRNEKNHLIYNDLPRFIMDSYEECRDPPRLDLLDKYDTGGPGSCLKRYSDPTFFKKASAIPDEENVEKVRRSRKAQRSKKKRGSQRNGDVLRGASASNRSSRMQHISPIVNGRSSSSQTASTADMALKSDLGDNSISFDSRTELGYIEYAAHPTSSMQAEEHESKESPTSKLVQHDDTIDSVSPADQTGFVGDNFPGSSLQDQVTSGSSCVNWDEKTEIVDPKCQQNGIDENTEIHPTKDDLDAHEAGAGNFRIVERMDALFVDENIVESILIRNQTDEIESEPDNFMDALNTIESESETDLDCQTKREVEHFASVVSNKEPYGVHDISLDCSGLQTTTFEFHTSTSYISFEAEVPTDLPNSALSESPTHKQMPQIDMEPSNPNHTVGTNSADIFYGSWLESVSGDSTSSGSGTTNLEDKTISSLYIPQESPADISRSNSTSPSSGATNEQDKTISSLCEAQESPADISRNNSTPSGSGTTNVKDEITSRLCESQESPADISRNNSTPSGSGTTNVKDEITSRLCESQESPADISRNNSTPSGFGTTNVKDEITSHLCESQESPADISRNNSTPSGSRTTNVKDEITSCLCESQESPADISRNDSTPSGSGTTNVKDEITSRLCESQESPADISRNNSTPSGSGTTNVKDEITSHLCESQESPADISRNNSTPSGSGTMNVKDEITSRLCESQESPAEISRNNSTPSGSGTKNVKDEITSRLCESQESPADISRNNSINFWTNGGLLGLEPSKPPDFTMPSSISQDSANRSHSETVGLSNHAYKLIVDEHECEHSPLVENAGCNDKDLSSKCSISCSENQDDGITFKKIPNGFSPTELYPKLRNLGDTMEPGTVLPVVPYGKSTSNEAIQGNEESSSRVFGLGRMLLVNGFGRKAAQAHDDGSEPASYSNAGVLDQKNEQHRVEYQAFPETSFRDQFEHGTGIDSSPSSPPLEHMKISFLPVDGIETSILKLKLSDGNQGHESVRDMFQSFQLIPEPAIALHEFGSDSDDDTFCRSSPYISDDCHSQLSESNSEQWESSETLERNNHGLYDGLCGISSEELISTSPELGGISHNATYDDGGSKSVHTENGLEHSLSDPVLDLPSFDALGPVLQQETKDDSDPKDLPGLRCSVDYTPGPPPLPPVEWRASKPPSNVTEEKQDAFEGFRHALNAELLGSITLQQPKPPVQQQQMNEDFIKPKRKQDQHLNGQKEADQALNGKGMDEKEDFLQQIRTKSFNLRRTVPAKAADTPVPTTNFKVTAILEKANAIRQAVGSDEGDDDDTWSDT
ncbi:protein SCAR3 isoform X1 [Malus domestica]|uniref:protein SCAR3 isoform X1 n=1 Tax=Malus domestica TaxID=3750 RepID=UPI003976EB9E